MMWASSVQIRPKCRLMTKQTILVMPNIISAFRDLDCSRNVYWGTSAGRSGYFEDYFRGLAYAMSWPLVRESSLNTLMALGFMDRQC